MACSCGLKFVGGRRTRIKVRKIKKTRKVRKIKA